MFHVYSNESICTLCCLLASKVCMCHSCEWRIQPFDCWETIWMRNHNVKNNEQWCSSTAKGFSPNIMLLLNCQINWNDHTIKRYKYHLYNFINILTIKTAASWSIFAPHVSKETLFSRRQRMEIYQGGAGGQALKSHVPQPSSRSRSRCRHGRGVGLMVCNVSPTNEPTSSQHLLLPVWFLSWEIEAMLIVWTGGGWWWGGDVDGMQEAFGLSATNVQGNNNHLLVALCICP